jgi:hypothetical protein
MTTEQYNQIETLLAGPKTSSYASKLNAIYKQLTGKQIKVGCLCKQTNIDKIFTSITTWFNDQNINN